MSATLASLAYIILPYIIYLAIFGKYIPFRKYIPLASSSTFLDHRRGLSMTQKSLAKSTSSSRVMENIRL
ncbi:hypothetical protein JTE90_012184 [Oedothorax gibbosus]|uniref:Uncharacterized protein n=1 Tax=Oedothorax gibbosus TaxID=931172 RepID=A0AAV6VBF9_9ARAC|nr:hypothetical protein JTE90_012184 [Oedothorax gibbosus]